MYIQAHGGDLNYIRSNDVKPDQMPGGDVMKWDIFKGIAISLFLRHKLETIDTVIVQITHTLTVNSPVTDIVLKSMFKELMNTKVAKKAYL